MSLTLSIAFIYLERYGQFYMLPLAENNSAADMNSNRHFYLIRLDVSGMTVFSRVLCLNNGFDDFQEPACYIKVNLIAEIQSWASLALLLFLRQVATVSLAVWQQLQQLDLQPLSTASLTAPSLPSLWQERRRPYERRMKPGGRVQQICCL